MNAANKIFSALFVAMLSLPLIYALTGPLSAKEQKALSEALNSGIPAVSAAPAAAKPGALVKWYNDHFPGRDFMVRTNNLARIAVFAESPVAGVTFGRKNWLYYSNEDCMEDYENLVPFTPAYLDQIERILTERVAWLKARGIAFCSMVAPNSQTVYPEFLPGYVHKFRPTSRLDQLTERLAARPDIPFIDFRSTMADVKKIMRAYHRTDSHWNDWGGFHAVNLILSRIGRDLSAVRPDSLDNFTIETRVTHGWDLAEMLSLADVITEETITLTPTSPRAAKPAAGALDAGGRPTRAGFMVMETGKPHLPRAVIFHDSFFVPLMPFVSEHFSRVVYSWTQPFDPDLVEREKPDVVLMECAERYIYALTIENPERMRRELSEKK